MKIPVQEIQSLVLDVQNISKDMGLISRSAINLHVVNMEILKAESPSVALRFVDQLLHDLDRFQKKVSDSTDVELAQNNVVMAIDACVCLIWGKALSMKSQTREEGRRLISEACQIIGSAIDEIISNNLGVRGGSPKISVALTLCNLAGKFFKAGFSEKLLNFFSSKSKSERFDTEFFKMLNSIVEKMGPMTFRVEVDFHA